jgi:D-beta-D-heptose 7-phosphate kinase/D-beta-D-heptose 1-phosphate adenosyltransferase
MSLTRARVEQLIAGLAEKRILVLGDIMLDEFIWGRVRRISPEAPVPVVDVTEETYHLGGAGNVASNIRAMDGIPIPLGVIGKDAAAERVLSLMREKGIDAAGLVQDSRPTTLKTRIIARSQQTSQQIVRADRESRSAPNGEITSRLEETFLRLLTSIDAIVISDYDKGVASRALLTRILPAAREARVPVFLDPKNPHADYYRPITMIKPNQREAELLSGMVIENEKQLEQAGLRLLEKFDCDYALITRGEDGMSLFHRGGSQHLPTFARDVFDGIGAGDTVIATLALARAGGASMEEAAILANHAAGIVVGKIGAATANRSELLADFDARNG